MPQGAGALGGEYRRFYPAPRQTAQGALANLKALGLPPSQHDNSLLQVRIEVPGEGEGRGSPNEMCRLFGVYQMVRCQGETIKYGRWAGVGE
jgi:hypothetical protein